MERYDVRNAPLLLARTRLEWAEATVGAGGDASSKNFAAQRFLAAREVADRLGLATVARRAREGLSGLGL